MHKERNEQDKRETSETINVSEIHAYHIWIKYKLHVIWSVYIYEVHVFKCTRYMYLAK